MKLTGKVVKVTERSEQILNRGEAPVTKQFEDVSIDVTGGEPFANSAACTPIGITVDAPAHLGKFREGQTVEIEITLK